MAEGDPPPIPLPPTGCLTGQDITAARLWRQGVEKYVKEDTEYWEVVIPARRVPDLIRGEQAVGPCRFLVKKERPGPERPAPGRAPTINYDPTKKRVHTTYYHCHHGPEVQPKDQAGVQLSCRGRAGAAAPALTLLQAGMGQLLNATAPGTLGALVGIAGAGIVPVAQPTAAAAITAAPAMMRTQPGALTDHRTRAAFEGGTGKKHKAAVKEREAAEEPAPPTVELRRTRAPKVGKQKLTETLMGGTVAEEEAEEEQKEAGASEKGRATRGRRR